MWKCGGESGEVWGMLQWLVQALEAVDMLDGAVALQQVWE